MDLNGGRLFHISFFLDPCHLHRCHLSTPSLGAGKSIAADDEALASLQVFNCETSFPNPEHRSWVAKLLQSDDAKAAAIDLLCMVGLYLWMSILLV